MFKRVKFYQERLSIEKYSSAATEKFVTTVILQTRQIRNVHQCVFVEFVTSFPSSFNLIMEHPELFKLQISSKNQQQTIKTSSASSLRSTDLTGIRHPAIPEEEPTALLDFYEVVPNFWLKQELKKQTVAVSSERSILRSSISNCVHKSRQNRSHSLPVVHGNFVLLNRGLPSRPCSASENDRCVM